MPPINNPDTTNEDPKYWEDVLRSHGLSMARADRPNLVTCVGGNPELMVLEMMNINNNQTELVPARPKKHQNVNGQVNSNDR